MEDNKHEVVIYSGDWCPHCRRVKAKLGQLGVDYTEIYVAPGEEGEARRQEIVELTGGGRSIPTVIIDGEAYLVPENEELEEYLT